MSLSGFFNDVGTGIEDAFDSVSDGVGDIFDGESIDIDTHEDLKLVKKIMRGNK